MSGDYGRTGLYYIAHHPESIWPWFVVWHAGRSPIARFADEGGCQRWVGYLERAALDAAARAR